MLCMTRNMGGANQTAFSQEPESSLPGAETYDVVAICAQECPRKFKTRRATEIEAYMRQQGFTTVSNELLDMWEMFLLVFVKAGLFDQITNVSTAKLAKGAMRQMIGNKGCIALNFTLRD